MNKMLLTAAIAATVWYHLNKKAKAAPAERDQSMTSTQASRL